MENTNTIKIESLNIHGGFEEKKSGIQQYLNKNKPDVLLIQESHLLPEAERFIKWEGYTAFYNSTTKQQVANLGKNRRRGVITIVANKWKNLITVIDNTEHNAGRLITIRLHLTDRLLTIFNIYAPTEKKRTRNMAPNTTTQS